MSSLPSVSDQVYSAQRKIIHVSIENGTQSEIKAALDVLGSPNFIYASERIGACTPLHLASLYGHVEVVRLFLDYGAYVNITSLHGHMPLDLAIKNKFPAVIGLLAEHGAKASVTFRDREKRCTEALHPACRVGNVPAVKCLFGLGADVNAIDPTYRNLLFMLHAGKVI